jgi:hypothetical protein
MTDQNLTQLLLIVDSSSSMQPIASDMNGAIANLLDEQFDLPGKLVVDVTTFNEKVTFALTEGGHTAATETAFVRPGGLTALNDAIALSIQRLGDRLAALPEEKRPGKVIVAIVTDGEENKSMEYPGTAGRARVKAMIEVQQNKYSWEFLFFGVGGLDKVRDQSASYGVLRNSTMSYEHSATGTVSLAAAAGSYMTASRLDGIQTTLVPDDEEEPKVV